METGKLKCVRPEHFEWSVLGGAYGGWLGKNHRMSWQQAERVVERKKKIMGVATSARKSPLPIPQRVAREVGIGWMRTSANSFTSKGQEPLLEERKKGGEPEVREGVWGGHFV